jgi:hypothetical protein
MSPVEIVARTPEKRIQKANGARRNGSRREDGNEVRLIELKQW